MDSLQKSAHVITETIDHIKTVVTLGTKEYFIKSIKRYLQSHSWYVASNIHYPMELYIYNMAPMDIKAKCYLYLFIIYLHTALIISHVGINNWLL